MKWPDSRFWRQSPGFLIEWESGMAEIEVLRGLFFFSLKDLEVSHSHFQRWGSLGKQRIWEVEWKIRGLVLEVWNLRHPCRHVKYTVAYRNLRYQKDIKDWSLNLGAQIMNAFLKPWDWTEKWEVVTCTIQWTFLFSKDNSHNWGVKFSCQILQKIH